MKAIMNLFCICLASPGTAGSVWGRAKSSQESISVLSESPTGSRSGFEVNLTDRFFELVQDPSYVQAVAELVELQKKSTCSRQATLDFMDLCKNHEKYLGYSAKASEQQIEILEESYAVSLAICELKKGGIAFPSECVHFETGSAGSRGTIQINQDQLQSCIKSLNKDGTHWTSFSNSLEKATVIRQAARVSVEKDQLIEIFKKGAAVYDETIIIQAQMVTRFTDQLDTALANLAHDLKDREAETHSFVHSLQHRFSNFMVNAMRDVSGLTANVIENLRTVVESMESMEKASGSAQSHFQKIEETGVHAREVQQSLMFGAQKGLETVLNLQDLLMAHNSRFESVNVNMKLLQQRQDAMERRSAETLVMMANLTEYLETAAFLGGANVEILEKARQASTVLLNHIEAASTSMTSRLLSATGPFGVSPALLISCPLMTVFLGSYGLEASIYRNIALGSSGVVLAKVLTEASNWDWYSDFMSAWDMLPFFGRGNQVLVEVDSVETEPVIPDNTNPEDLAKEPIQVLVN